MLNTTKPVRRIVVPGKPEAVHAFVNGKSIADIAADTCSHRLRIEQVIREAIQGLAALKVPGSAPPPGEVTNDLSRERDDHQPSHNVIPSHEASITV